MLFNSPEFIFAFLPLVLLGWHLVARLSARAALGWLALASLLFYAWWNPRWLPLMLLSMGLNLMAAQEIAARVGVSTDPSGNGSLRLSAHTVTTLAVVTDLLLLAYYKYAGFLGDNLGLLLGQPMAWGSNELPLGISFFTFTQIAFLVDVYQRKAADFDPLRYGLFVTYYPHLIAGPILHHRDMMPQFWQTHILRFDAARLADGLVLFILGLTKKTVLADSFAGYATPTFDAAALATQAPDITLFAGWGAALAYALQIYFDFSGYSDMAIGLAAMIGIRLPANFDSPYQARNIADFWRRWHMTLSTFLRDYLYIPLGGNRRGLARQQLNLMTTMLLGGLWHGAGWTFVVWGGLHGGYLMVFHAWQRMVGAATVSAAPERRSRRWLVTLQVLSRLLARPITLLAVVLAWVFFRAHDLPAAWALLRAMAGCNGSLLPDQIIAMVPLLGRVADGAGKVPLLGDGTVMGLVEMVLMLALGLAIALLAPNLARMSERLRYALVLPCGALALQRVLYGQASPFLYFQF